MEWQITSNAVAIADDGGVGILVFCAYCPRTPQHLYTLVVAINGLAAILNRADHAIVEAQQDGGCVYIASLANRCVYHHASQRKNFVHFAVDQKTGHVEIMNSHIKKEAA